MPHRQIKKALLHILENLYQLPSSSHFWIIESTQDKNSLTRHFSESYQEIAQENYQGFSLLKYQDIDEQIDFLFQVREDDFVAKCFDQKVKGPTKKIKKKIEQTKFYLAHHSRLNQIPLNKIAHFSESLEVDYQEMYERGERLTQKLRQASNIKLITGDDLVLEYKSPLKAVFNYSGHFIRGNVPTGEVFSEPQELFNVDGQARALAFDNYLYPQGFDITIKNGRLVDYPDLPEFKQILECLERINNYPKLFEKGMIIRELGFGLNPGVNLKYNIANAAYLEKALGTAHISLGPSHYHFSDSKLRKHLPLQYGHYDLILDLKEMYLDDQCIFKNTQYLV